VIKGLGAYPEYKDSGLPWLGEVPAHWEVRRMRDTASACVAGIWGGEPDGQNDLVCVRVADFDRARLRVRLDHPTLRSIGPSERRRRLLSRGDLLLEKSGGGDQQPVGVVVLFDHDVEAVSSNFVAKLTVSERYDPKYLVYLHSTLYELNLNARSIKQTTGIQNLDTSAYLSEGVALPALAEQAAIVHFLDHADRRIQRYLRAKQKLIKLLEEQKQATIRGAVTRGLDPNVSLKPSGIEWLGDVPEHWDVVRAARICQFLPGKAHEQFIEPDGEFVCATARFVSTEGRTARHCSVNLCPARIGDVLMVMSDLPRGRALARAYYVDDDGKYAVNQRVCVLRAHAINSQFLAYYANRNPQLLTHDDGSNQTHLPNAAFKTMLVLVPPPEEQAAIVTALLRLTGGIDRIVARARREIALLDEYRTRLIADLVTGKLDVRGAAARLSDEGHEVLALDEVSATDDDDHETDDLEHVSGEAEG